ncbi:MAG: glycosyltransferase family 4 protein [Desulfobacteraceae bacterium]|nr:glycosyltransferase family 4 protein [Desulfobacteraceae bacterium]
MDGVRTAYVLLWFPKPSETFIFNEVVELHRLGLPVSVHALYGRFPNRFSPGMGTPDVPVERLGLLKIRDLFSGLLYWVRRKPRLSRELFRTVFLRRWCDAETAGENSWAFLCGFHLGRRFQEESIEHIHAPWANGPATAAWVASRLTGIPFSFAAHAGDIYPPDGALEEKIRAAILVRTENNANVNHLRLHASGHEDKIRVIYSGHPPMGGRSATPLERPVPTILALGRLVPKKGFDVLIRACGLLRDRGVDFRLVLGGWGPRAGRLLRLARGLDLVDKIDFPGAVSYENVPGFMCSGDIFVMPSVIDSAGDRDGIPNVIVEALRCGLPVVATNVCGIPEVVRNGDTGILVPSGDEEAIADAIVRFARDPEGAREMARRGRELVLRDFDLRRNCLALLELFHEKLRASRTEPARAPFDKERT